MATSSTFDDMLNEYLAYPLLKEELVKRDYILKTVDKDDNWVSPDLIVPFKAAGASSIAMGALTASNDVAEDKFVRGSISSQPEAWGSLIFNQKDLMRNNKISEQNFLKLLPDTLDDFMDYMKMVLSLQFTNGSHFASAAADGGSDGTMVVDRVERFQINQKVGLRSSSVSLAYYYVTAIDVDNSDVTFSSSRGGSAADISTYTLAGATKCYFDGSYASGFTSLKSSLLSSTNGGSSTLYSQTKASYPYLQAINVSGSAITAVNILDKLFDAYTTIKIKGKGNPTDILVSYKHLGSIMKQLEVAKGAFNVVPGSTKVDVYGYTEIEVVGVKGKLKIVGIQEMDDDWMAVIDWRALKLHSNKFIQKRVSPEGKSYYEIRATTGYQYIVDMAFMGDLILNRPSYCGVIHSISY